LVCFFIFCATNGVHPTGSEPSIFGSSRLVVGTARRWAQAVAFALLAIFSKTILKTIGLASEKTTPSVAGSASRSRKDDGILVDAGSAANVYTLLFVEQNCAAT
jgi:hypothetical protein